MFCICLIITTRQKPTVDSQKIKEKGIKAYHHGKSIHKRSQQGKKKGARKLQNSQKTINKMALVSPYILIITLVFWVFFAMLHGLRDLSSLTRDRTWVFSSESAES